VYGDRLRPRMEAEGRRGLASRAPTPTLADVAVLGPELPDGATTGKDRLADGRGIEAVAARDDRHAAGPAADGEARPCLSVAHGSQ
jgi:hypothetical protein